MVQVSQIGVVASSVEVLPVWLIDKFLMLAYDCQAAGGEIPNIVDDGATYLTYTGSGLSRIYHTPNNATYIAADTDYCWFKTNGDVSDTDGNRLNTYDFERTIIRYGNVSPNAIDLIGILKDDATFTTDELNQMRDLFDLSVWWDDTLSLHGNTKSNRAIGQSVWTPENVDDSVGHWWLNDVTGATDVSSSGNNGTPVGTISVGDVDDHNSVANGATEFVPANGDSIDMATYTNLDLTNIGAVMGWLREEAGSSNYAGIIGKGAAAGYDSDGYAIQVNTSSQIVGWINNLDTGHQIVDFGTPTFGEWHHYAMVWTGSRLIGYLDGSEISNIAQTINVKSNVHLFRIGRGNSYTTLRFSGGISDARVYNYAPTPTQIEDIVNE